MLPESAVSRPIRTSRFRCGYVLDRANLLLDKCLEHYARGADNHFVLKVRALPRDNSTPRVVPSCQEVVRDRLRQVFEMHLTIHVARSMKQWSC